MPPEVLRMPAAVVEVLAVLAVMDHLILQEVQEESE
jgi:hypothetical protein